MISHVGRFVATALAAFSALVVLAPTALGQEEHASEPVNITGLALVGVIGIAIPLVFLLVSRAAQLRQEEGDGDEELEPVVAGIGQGGAPVPRWLYAVYVLIPLWAGLYFVNNQQVPGELASATPEATVTAEATTAPTPAPVKTEFTVIAENIEFDVDEIRAPANTEISIELDNRDAATSHNVAIYTDNTLATLIFEGGLFNGKAKRTYEFTTPGAGEYYFRCDVHPAMEGAFVVT